LAGRGSAFLERLSRSPLVIRVAEVWSWVWTTVRILWLCGYSVVAALVVLFLFVFNDQGRDLLRISAQQLLSWWNLTFFLGTAALSLTLWFTSRLLLGREFPAYLLDLSSARGRQRGLPRLLGVSAPLAVAVGLLRIESDDYQDGVWILAILYLLLAVLVFEFFRRRRKWFDVDPADMMEKPVTILEGCNLLLVWAGGVLSAALLVAFMIWPVALPQGLGAPGIIMLAFVGIVLFGSMALTYAFLAYDQPSATALALALAVLFGFWIDNHTVRLGSGTAELSRFPPGRHYIDWRRAHPDFTPVAGREPVILVAAAGGGIRAAYWTATNLAAMESLPGFGDSLFAISGVSGGSLGAATFTALKQVIGPGQSKVLAEKVRDVLKQDFLSPVVAGLLFPDLAQRFIPVSVRAADRQRFLELSWEDAMAAAVAPAHNPFSLAFTDLYSRGEGAGLPSLLLNATLVDSGRRAIVSNLDTGGFTDTVDLLSSDLSTRDILLSAAAGASARFTYVSPSGTLHWRQTSHGEGTQAHTLRVVDGGYFENSGAATAADLLAALHKQHEDRLFPILVLIRNDPKASAVCFRGSSDEGKDLSADASSLLSDDLLKEISAPVRALLNARTARGRLAEVDAARLVEAAGGAVIELSLAAVLDAAIQTANGDERKLARLKERAVEPPLGWSLSKDVRDEMDEVLKEGKGGLDREYAMLGALLQGKTDNYVPCRAR